MYKICKTEKSIARQRELEEGLLAYMETVPFFEMDITGLCRYLEIPRKTFYRYFGSKEDALYALIDHRMLDLHSSITGKASQERRSLRQDAQRFFRFWKEQKRFLDILNGNFLSGALMDRAITCSGLAGDNMGYPVDDADSAASYRENFYSAGLMSIMFKWYNGGFRKTTEEMADIVMELFGTPIAKNLNYFD